MTDTPRDPKTGHYLPRKKKSRNFEKILLVLVVFSWGVNLFTLYVQQEWRNLAMEAFDMNDKIRNQLATDVQDFNTLSKKVDNTYKETALAFDIRDQRDEGNKLQLAACEGQLALCKKKPSLQCPGNSDAEFYKRKYEDALDGIRKLQTHMCPARQLGEE